MELTSEEKLNMSLDEIIQFQCQPQERQQLQLHPRLKYAQYYQNRFYRQRDEINKNVVKRFFKRKKWYRLALFTRNYSQLAAYKSLQRAKYTLLQQHLIKRNEAYRRWKERYYVHDDIATESSYWDDVNSNFSANSSRLKSTRKWINTTLHADNICLGENLTVNFSNNSALRPQLNQLAQVTKKTPAIGAQLLPCSNEMVFNVSAAIAKHHLPMTLNERFSAFKRLPCEGDEYYFI